MNQQTGTFDVCCSTAASPLPVNNNNNNNRNQFQQQQRRPSNPAPVSVNIPTGSCPNIQGLPDISSCSGATSNCWSVGQADVDCPGNALCCFDGCVNSCYFGGK